MLLNDRFLKACLGEAVDQTPLWLMRQAGRYLPEYNATRARAGSFLGLAKNPAYATEVTLQPLDRYPLDAANSNFLGIFSQSSDFFHTFGMLGKIVSPKPCT